MTKPEYFEAAEGYACYRPQAEVPLAQAVDMVGVAITFATSSGITRLLVNTTGFKGLGHLSTMDRFKMAVQLADARVAPIKVAVVANAELIDPSRFGITVARNRGLFSNVFTTETDALQWLLDPKAA